MKQSTLKLVLTCLAVAGMSSIAGAQTIDTLGATAPTPGPNDISQFSITGNQTAPDGLNYFTDNGNPAGQTFTTGSNPSGYVLTNVVIKTGSASFGGNGTGIQATGYRLQVYSITGGTATQIGSFTVGAGTFSYTPGDWLQVSGLALLLSPNTTYAYTFQRRNQGWDNLDVASGSPYAGGEICLIPSAGGTVTTGGSHGFDAQFDIGLALAGPPVVGAPAATPNPCYALSAVTISDTAVLGNTYQWQTNSDISGGLGGTWVNVSGAAALSFTNSPLNIFPGGGDYTLDFRLIANNGSGSSTSAPLALVVHAASGPVLTADTTPASVVTFSGATVVFTASFDGTTPLTNQWQTDAGQSGTYTNIPNATTTTLTLTNVQGVQTGNYRLRASNNLGSLTSTPANLTVYPILYQERFNLATQPDQSVTNVGWRNDIQGLNNRIFTGNNGVTFPNCAVFSYDPGVANEAFYATTATANGSISNHMAFPIINLATVQNLVFGADLNTSFNGNLTHSYIAVQMNFGSWYVSTTELLPQPSSTTFITDILTFNPSASAWNDLTVSGNGGLNTIYPIIGSTAVANLTGYITGVGLVCTHDAGSTVQFDNYTVGGSIPPTALPVISSPPFSQTNYTGTAVTFNVTATTNGSTVGLTYQWRAGTVGSGVYANLSNGGQFSGVNSSSLTISNISSLANHKDYVVVVTDGAGSTTSAPPATLTVVDSAPILTADTSIYPDASPGFGTANASIHAGNNNTLHVTASYVGDLPISYQWQISPNPDGSGAANIPGANSSSLTLSNPQTTDSGYYSVRVSNSQSVTPTNSAWAQLTVLPESTSTIKWAAPVVINGLTASQILGRPPGTFFEAESFGATAPISVTNNGTIYLFDTTGAAATATASGALKTDVYIGPSTGDTNLDAVLSVDVENAGAPTITLNNLTPGQMYSAQLIALNDTAGNLREVNFSDSVDAADVSASFLMGDNVYVVGTFVAADVTQVIAENESNSHGYLSAVIVRNAFPTLTVKPSGSNLQLNWNFGTLLEATNITGPWTTNVATSPYVVTPVGPRKFFRVQFP